ncbi:MAG: hypothetical protein ACRC92_02405 [Peptostreptococcaceae bacterium]
MKNFYIGIIGTLISLIILFFLFLIAKGNLFWENKEEGLIFFIPVWSIILGAICWYVSYKYDKTKNAYINAGKDSEWEKYKISMYTKYSYLVAKITLLALPVALADYYLKNSEMLGTKLPFIYFLFIVGAISILVYLFIKRKIQV